MGRKIEDYANNVSANPSLDSVTDLSEKLGATYESRKWTLTDFLTWLNNNVNTNASFDFVNNTGATINKGQLVVLSGVSNGNPTIAKLTNSADVNNHSIIYIASENVLNGATGVFLKEGFISVSGLVGNVGDKVYYSTSVLSLTTTNNAEDSIFAGVIVSTSVSEKVVFFAPDKDNSILYSTASNQVPLFTGTKKAVGSENFTYVNSVGTEVGYRLTDSPNNNLTQLGIGYLNVETEGLSQNSATRLANWSDSTNKGILSFRKARGTKATPTQVFQGDVLGHIIYAGQHNQNGGTTTAIIEVSAVENYDVNLNPNTSNYERYALTQFSISLAPSFSESGVLGGFPNQLVFKVNGDGKVSFKNYEFPILDGTANQVLTTNGAGQLTWANASTGVTGSGTQYTLPIWSNTNQLGDSLITQNSSGTMLGINTNVFGNFALVNIVSTQQKGIHVDNTNEFGVCYSGTSTSSNGYAKGIDVSSSVSGTSAWVRGVIGSATANNYAFSIGGDFTATSVTGQDYAVGIKSQAISTDNNTRYCFWGQDGTQGLNKVLTCVTADGKAQWKDISTITTFIPDLKGHETFRGVNFSNNSTTDVISGGVTLSTSASTIARSVSTTNYATKQIRKGYYASVVSTGRYTGVRGSALLWYVGGGFKYVCEFYVSDTAFGSGCRQFYGMAGQTTDLGYTDTILVSSLLNVIGVGSDSADSNLQIFYNDGAGACTKIDLGANFPSNRTAGAVMTTTYSVAIYNAPNSTSVNVQVINKETGAISQNTLTSNLPLDTQGLNFFASRTMGTPITNTGQFDLSILGVYSL